MRKLSSLSFFVLFTLIVSAQSAPIKSAGPPFTAKMLQTKTCDMLTWIYGTGVNGEGFYFKGNSGWQSIAWNTGKQVKKMAPGHGRSYVLTTDGTLYQHNNGRWFKMTEISAVKDIANSGRLLVLGTFNGKPGLYGNPTSNGKGGWNWASQSSAAVVNNCVLIDEDMMGSFFLVSGGSQMYYVPRGGAPELVSSSTTPGVFRIKDIHVSRNGMCYASDNSNNIYEFNRAKKVWTSMGIHGSTFGVDKKDNVYTVEGSKVMYRPNLAQPGNVRSLGQPKEITAPDPNKLDANGNTTVTKAVSGGDVSAFNTAMAGGGNINAPNKDGNTPLILAIQNKNKAMATAVVNKGADIKKADKEGRSPLWWAIYHEQYSTVKLLLDKGADPNGKDIVTAAVASTRESIIEAVAKKGGNISPGLVYACERGEQTLFDILIKHGAKITDNKPFAAAVDNNKPKLAKKCLDNGADKNAALKYSVEKGNSVMIGMCLEKGASPGPAIDYAVDNNNVELAVSLVTTYGVPANQLLGKTMSKSAPNVDMVRTAVQNGADPTPHIDAAVRSNNATIYNLFLDNGADANAALGSSVSAGNVQFARTAMNKGARPSGGHMSSAVGSGSIEMTQALISGGGNAADGGLVKTAVGRSDVPMVRLLTDNGAPVSDPSLMQTSVKNDNYEMSSLLLEKGASANDPQLLVTTVNKENQQMADLLINHGAPIDNPAVLKAAVDRNSLTMTNYLIGKGAPATDPGLIKQAVYNNNTEIGLALLNAGAPATDPYLIKTTIEKNNTELSTKLLVAGADAKPAELIQKAISHKNKEVVEALINHGADANNGIGPAVKANLTDISILLLQNGADAKDPTLIESSARNGNLEITTKLVESGANPENGAPASVSAGKAEILRYLIQNGVKADKAEYANTAVFNNHAEVFQIVTENGAPVTQLTSNGESLLHHACRNKSELIMKILVAKGLDVNMKDANGDSPLHIVVRNKNAVGLARVLVEGGADINATDAKGKSVLKRTKGKQTKNYLKTEGAQK